MARAEADDADALELFLSIDTNHDGTLSEFELRNELLRRGYRGEQLEEKLRQWLSYDEEKRGGVSKAEFISHVDAFYVMGPPKSKWVALNIPTSSVDHAVRTLLAGGIAGAISRTVVAPFERLKIIFQTQGHPPIYTSVWQGLSGMYRNEGVRGFFRGNGINCVRVVPASAIQFYTFDTLKKSYIANVLAPKGINDLNVPQRLCIGGLAGICSQLAVYPLEMIRARLTIQTTNVYTGIGDAFSKIVKNEGALALYKGLWPSLIGIIPYIGIDFAAYETLKQYSPKNADGTVSRQRTLMNGAVAGCIAQTIAYPLDVVRRRLQVQGFSVVKSTPERSYTGMTDAFIKIWKTEGIRGYYRGLVPNYMKVIPAIATSFASTRPINMIWFTTFVLCLSMFVAM